MRAATMRAATASAREPRGERTLMGIGPEFIRREIIADGVSGTLDGVPLERMDRTPSSPIVVEPQAVLPSATVRMSQPSQARTVQVPVAPSATVVLPAHQPSAAGAPSTRLDSLVSARFFQEGEQQEAKNWEDSPLVIEPFPDEEPPKISSFDRVPRHRAPLLVTTFLLGTGLVIGLAIEGADAGVAREWLANEAGPRAVAVWHRAKDGLALRLTPQSTTDSARAMADPAQAPAPGVVAATAPAANPVAPVGPTGSAAAEPGITSPPPGVSPAPASKSSDEKANEDLWAPLVAAPSAPRRSDKLITSRPQVPELWHHSLTSQPRATEGVTARVQLAPHSADEQTGASGAAVASTEPASSPEARDEARHGVVWSPAKQRLVPVEAASAEVPVAQAPGTDSPRASDIDQRAAKTAEAKSADKDVLPLDEEAHATY